MEEYNKELEEKQLKLEKQKQISKVFKILLISQVIILCILIVVAVIDFEISSSCNGPVYSPAEIATFNNQFLKYEGTQKGSVVKSLIYEAIASNSDPNHQSHALVSVTLGEINMNPSELSTKEIDTQKYFNVELLYSNEGRVNEIKITPVEEEE